ncbi:MAG: hypothetical protein JWR09_3744 [Mucilaginibacter sp.]|nr:hypothetical protein [Mucilaginibacter sp.]
MNIEEKKFGLYLTILRFLTFKITENLRRVYLDFDINSHKILLTAFYQIYPSELELELLDDIVTDSDAHIPDFFVESCVKLVDELSDDEYKKHEFVVFAFYYE